tara:strand:+ start:884 stop:2113 length:1230 start_codon:yes stop_codon:yes gene_type:complete
MNVKVRKFPYPFKCAFSISSDIDNGSSLESFVQFMDFLNSENQTIYGPGLGLEVGNSFWFFNGSKSFQLSYFKGLTHKETLLAPIIRTYLQSRHIDTLHSWGNFDKGGFRRSYANKGMEVLNKYNFDVPVWVNHGINLNYQKIGDYPNMHGDDPNHSCYHSDLLFESGFEYVWTGKVTHIIGQEGKNNFSIFTKSIIQKLFKKIRYQNVKDPIYDDDNKLLRPLFLRDGNKTWEFIRFINSWGNAGQLDLYEFSDQIKIQNLKRLIKNQGFMILYTHFNENLSKSIPKKLYHNLKVLKQMVDSKDILMGTTSRILKYWEISNYVSYEVQDLQDKVIITINEDMHCPIGIKSIKSFHLSGLTFYINIPKPHNIVFKNKLCKTIINPPDETGEKSISIPWQKLEYPIVSIL